MSDYKIWECEICGVIYNEALGWPDEGLAPGTLWQDVPDDWLCPDCGVGKEDFEMVATAPAVANAPANANLKASSEKAAPEVTPVAASATAQTSYQLWECEVCGVIYDEALGWPDDNIAPGTLWADVPDDWYCPDCGVGKEDFECIGASTSSAPAEAVAALKASLKTVDVAETEIVETQPETAITNQPPVVIIGTGLAGYNLAREFRKLDHTTPLVIITGDNGDYYSKPQLSTAFAKQKTARQLCMKTSEEMALELNADIHIFTRVDAINTDNRQLSLSTGTINYGKLVLATGASCIQLPLQGNGLDHVYSINDLADLHRFRTAITGRKKVLVIGAGLIGCEFANDLICAGFDVEVVDPMPHPLASLLPGGAAAEVQQALAAQGVTFHFGTVVECIDKHTDQPGVMATLQNGDVIHADLVLSAVGVRARTELAEQAGLEVKRGIVTNRQLQTSASDVYALGDCAEVDGHLLYYIEPLMQSARALAKTLAGTPTTVCYGAMPVAVKTTLCPVVVAPVARDTQGQWISSTDDDGLKAEFCDNQQLLGFALTGKACSERSALTKALPPLMQ